MHQALSYSTSITTLNGVTSQTVQRYFAGEITPNYFIAKCMSVGMYYLYSYGLDNPNVRNTNYVMMNLNFSNLTLVKGFTVSYMPAVYYLQINHNKGYNVTSSLTLAKRNFPVSMNAFVNKTIRSEIPGHKDFVWNISLIYAFSHAYAKQ